jgi:hypothetical protein
MNKFRRIIKIIFFLPVLLGLVACAGNAPTSIPVSMLKPGGKVGEMILQTGAGESQGPPLWAFCSPAFANPGVTTVDCTVPALPELSIGHGWWGKDQATTDSNWKSMKWELYLDGQAIDLAAFGTFDADLPQTGLPGYAADQEVMTKLRSWDVLLTNLTPGAHTLRSVLNISKTVNDGFTGDTAAGTYELVVNFTIEAGQ